MATQKDVAKLANVSFITVSRVINNRGNVKKETKLRVKKAIEELNYYPNSIAQGLNSNRSKTLAIQAPLPVQVSIEGTSYYRRLLIGVEKYCITMGYDVLISSQRNVDNKLDLLKPFYKRKSDGLIIIAAKPTPEQVKQINDDKIPCVIIGDRYNNMELNYIDTDNTKGITTATEYLIKNGHKKIAYIKGNQNNQNAVDRFNGFLKSTKKSNLNITPEWIFDGDYTKECGASALNYFMSLKTPPTAVISSTDLMAIGFYEEAIKLGIKIPQDISIIGFDGHEVCTYTNPPLATMYQPLEEMGYAAAKILIDQIENGDYVAKNIIFPVNLIPGGSVLNSN